MSGLYNRVIPCLLLQDGGLVKTRQFGQSKYVGDPINAVRIFNDKYVDELIFLDIRASLSNLDPDYDLIERIAGECFMPLCYGGGVKSLAQAKKLVSIGVEKIAVNSAFIHNSRLIQEMVCELGTQSVVGAVDIKRNFWGQDRVYDASRKCLTSMQPETHIKHLIDEGVGEILINDVDRDGMFNGYNIERLSQLSQISSVPLIVCGGAKTLSDMQQAFDHGASAAAAGSMFVFYGPHRAVLITYPEYAQIKKLFAGNAYD